MLNDQFVMIRQMLPNRGRENALPCAYKSSWMASNENSFLPAPVGTDQNQGLSNDKITSNKNWLMTEDFVQTFKHFNIHQVSRVLAEQVGTIVKRPWFWS